MKINFTKMHGLGNDFIVIDCRKKNIPSLSRLIKKLSHRQFGIGFDQALILLPSKKADFRMDIYNADGSANSELIDDIIHEIEPEKVLWEAPNKAQQVYFIKLLGHNVNLGNIATNEVFALEALRLGLRGDTFFDFLPNHCF